LVESNYSTEIFWFPFNGYTNGYFNGEWFKNTYDPYKNSEIWVKTVNLTDIKSLSKLEEWIQDEWNDKTGYLRISAAEVIRNITNADIGITPILLSPAMLAIPHGKCKQLFGRAIHYQKYIDLILVRDSEAVFKVSDDYSNVKLAFEQAIDLIMKYHKDSKYPCRVSVEFRIINGSDSVLLAQCLEKNLDPKSRYAYIEILDYEHGKDNTLWEQFMCELSGKWRKIKGYVFQHWAKEFPKYDVDEEKAIKYSDKKLLDWANITKDVFGDRLDLFQKHVKVFDPKGIFTNKWLREILLQNNN